MHKIHRTKNITAPNNINGYQYTVPVASSVVINDAWNASYKEHRPWLLRGINTPYRWHRPWLLMMHKMHPTKDITAPNNINGASIHRTGGIERGY
jgi:hypothetical protein